MSAPAPPTATSRQDASMSLLTHLTERSLDEGYAEAAARREPGATYRTGVVLAAGLVGVGLLLSTAGGQARNRESAVAAARVALIEKIEERSARADALAADVAALRESVADARHDRLRLTSSGASLARQLARLEAVAGVAPVAGPGVVVRLEDAPEPEPVDAANDPRNDEELAEGRVTDRDLQTIVNEIWLAGAEAVAINGQRLTAMSAIRSAGPNILVAFRPLVPPYEVAAIGDPATMKAKITEGFGGSYLEVLRNYGIQFSVQTRSKLRLPASAGVRLRQAIVPAEVRRP